MAPLRTHNSSIFAVSSTRLGAAGFPDRLRREPGAACAKLGVLLLTPPSPHSDGAHPPRHAPLIEHPVVARAVVWCTLHSALCTLHSALCTLQELTANSSSPSKFLAKSARYLAS